MPVTLKLSDEDALNLAEMLSLSALIASHNQQDMAESRLMEWGILIARLMKELSPSPKLKGKMEYDDELNVYTLTPAYEENAFFHDCLDEYQDQMFWSELVTRMADKAISEHLSPEYFDNMSEDERRKVSETLEKSLWQECTKYGIDRMGFILPPEDA